MNHQKETADQRDPGGMADGGKQSIFNLTTSPFFWQALRYARSFAKSFILALNLRCLLSERAASWLMQRGGIAK